MCLGNVYELIKENNKAVIEYKKVLQMDKKNTRAFEALAKLQAAGFNGPDQLAKRGFK